jgi:hypothetical protein
MTKPNENEAERQKRNENKMFQKEEDKGLSDEIEKKK